MQAVIVASQSRRRGVQKLRNRSGPLPVFPVGQRAEATADAEVLTAFRAIELAPAGNFLGEQSDSVRILGQEMLIQRGIVNPGTTGVRPIEVGGNQMADPVRNGLLCACACSFHLS